jgi:hypothetical protein
MPEDVAPARQTAPLPTEAVLQRGALYPNYQRGIVSQLPGDADAFDVLREQLLLGYGFQTARAYWADLEHWRDWCREQQPAVDPLNLTGEEQRRYVQALDAAGYATTTRARRQSILRRFGNLTGPER